MEKGNLLALTVLVLALSGAAAADDDAPPLSPQAKAVIEAARADDTERLRQLIENGDTNPYVVAHELCVHGEIDAVRAFVRASDRSDLKRLQSYVAKLVRRRPSMDRWKRRLEAYALWTNERWFQLQEMLADLRAEDATNDVSSMCLLYAKGIAALNLDEERDACAHFQAAAEIAESIGSWSAAVEMLREALAAARTARDFKSQINAQKRIIDIHTLSGNRSGTARGFADLGCVHGNLRDYGRALEYFETVLEQYEDALSDGARIHLMQQTGLAYLSEGHLALAYEILLKALAEARALEDESLVAQAHEYLGLAALEVREFEEAEAHLLRALEYRERAGHPRIVADLHGHLGLLAWHQDDLAEADTQWKLAATLYADADLPHGAIRAQIGCAAVLRRTGKCKEAFRELRGILDRLESLEDRLAESEALDEMALVCRAMKKYPRAFAYRNRHLKMAEDSASVQDQIKALGELAWLHVDRRQYAEAIRCARRAEDVLGGMFDRLPTVEAALTRERTARVYEAGLAAAVALKDADQACFFLDGGRAGALLTALEGRCKIREVQVAPELRERETAARTEEAIASAELAHAREVGLTEPAQAARRRLDEVRDALRKAIQQIQLSGTLAADLLYPSPLERKEIQAKIGPGDVLVTYGSYDVEGIPGSDGHEALVALVLGADEPRLVPLGSAQEVDEIVRDVLHAMKPGKVKEEDEPDLEGLRERLVKPLGLPKGVRRVLLSPVGRISYLPPALLFPDQPVVCVPSASAMSSLVSQGAGAGKGVLAVGDAIYDGSPLPRELRDGGSTRGPRLGPLPGTRIEANSVGTTVLLDKDASETNVRAALTDPTHWRSVHFACHGVVNESRPSYSALVLTRTDQDDGYLKAIDVFRMTIRTDLAVLSACDTGRGRLVKAEGIVGLTSAFLVAGAPRVLVSLWKVDDDATQALMVKFYELWNPSTESGKDPLPASEALREAQKHVRTLKKKWDRPYYWAGWTLWGAAD